MDIGTLTGTIEIEDQMSHALESAAGKVKSFVSGFVDSFGEVSVAAAAAVTAITAVTAAITNLGQRGADINDVASTMDQFTKSARISTDIIEKMAAGTQHTVDSFVLMKSAAKLLSSGALQNAEDFGTLTQAAFVLQNRGLGSTTQMMQSLQQALVTGRTRVLEQAGVFVDTAGAARTYAEELGKTTSELTKLELKHAQQIAVLNAMKNMVAAAGAQQRDFGEQLEAAHTYISNFVDDLASAVAKSPAIMQALTDIGNAFVKVFGGDAQSLAIDAIVAGFDSFARAVSSIVPYVQAFASAMVTLTKFLYQNRDVIIVLGEAWLAYKVLMLSGVIPSIISASANIGALTGANVLNAVATTEMAAAEGIMTIATMTLGQAVKGLWVIIAANPLGAAAVAAGALGLALSKLATWYYASGLAASEAQNKTDTMKKAMDAGWASSDGYKSGLTSLTDAINFNTEVAAKAGHWLYSVADATKELGNQSWGVTDKVKVLTASVVAASNAGNLGTAVQMALAKAIKEAGIAYDDLSPALKAIIDATKIEIATAAAAAKAQADHDKALKDAKAAAEAHKKAVEDLVKTLTIGSDSLKVQAEAFGRLTPAQLANADVLQRIAPLLEKLAEANGHLTAKQLEAYDASLKSHDALQAKDRQTLLSSQYTLTYIEGQQELGRTETQMAVQLGVSTEAFKRYVAELQGALTRLHESEAEGASAASAIGASLAGMPLVLTGLAQSTGPVETRLRLTTVALQGFTAQGALVPDVMTSVNAAIATAMQDSTQRVTTLSNANADLIHRMAAVGMTAEQIAAQLKPVGVTLGQINDELHLTVQASTALSDLASGFQRVGQAAGGTLGQIIGQMGTIITLTDNAVKATEQWGKNAQGQKQQIGGSFGYASVMGSDLATNGQKAAAAYATVANTMAGIGQAQTALDQKSRLSRAEGMMSAGATIGSSFGPWGTAIGAAGGFIAGLISGKPKWAQVQDEMAKSYGVSVSDELSKAIADSAKKDFGGSTQAASVSHLADIIKEGGGLSSSNLSLMTDRLHDVFSMIDTKQMSVAQGTKVLDDNFAEFAKTGTSAYGALNKSLVDIIKLNDQFGTKSQAISEYVGAQGQAGAQAFGAALHVGAQAMDDYNKAQTDRAVISDQIWAEEQKGAQASTSTLAGLQAQYDDLTKTMTTSFQLAQATSLGGSAAWQTQNDLLVKQQDLLDQIAVAETDHSAAGQAHLAELKTAYAATGPALEAANQAVKDGMAKSQTAADAFAVGISSDFQSMISSGMSYADAVKAIQPAMQDLGKQMATAGVAGSAVFDSLQTQVALYADEVTGPALQSVDSLTAAMVSLDNQGKGTQGTFYALSGQVTNTFDTLVSQGHDSHDVMLAMSGSLQRMWEEQQEFGYKTDDATTALLNQAEADGIVGETHKDVNQQMLDATNKMVDALNGIAEKLGVTIPKAATAAADATKGIGSAAQTAADVAKQAAKDMAAGFKGVEDAATGAAEGHSPTGIQQIVVRGGQMVSTLVPGTNQVAAGLKRVEDAATGASAPMQKVLDAITDFNSTIALTDDQKAFVQTATDAGVSVGDLAAALNVAQAPLQRYTDELKVASDAQKHVADTTASVTKQLADYHAALVTLSSDQQAFVKDATAAGVSVEDLATVLGISSRSVSAYTEQQAAAQAASDKITTAQRTVNDLVSDYHAALTTLSPSQQAFVADATAAGASVADLAIYLGVSQRSIAVYTTQIKDATTATATFTKAQQDAVTATAALIKSTADSDLAKVVQDAVSRLGNINIAGSLETAQSGLRQAQADAATATLQGKIDAATSATKDANDALKLAQTHVADLTKVAMAGDYVPGTETIAMAMASAQAAQDVADAAAKAQADLEAQMATAKTAAAADDLTQKFKDEVKSLGMIPTEYAKTYGAASDAIHTQYGVQYADLVKNRADQLAALGPVPTQYDATYAAAVDAVETQFTTLSDHLKDATATQIANLGPIPSAYEAIYTQAFDTVKAKYDILFGQLGVTPDLPTQEQYAADYESTYAASFASTSLQHTALMAELAASPKSPETSAYETAYQNLFDTIAAQHKSMLAGLANPPAITSAAAGASAGSAGAAGGQFSISNLHPHTGSTEADWAVSRTLSGAWSQSDEQAYLADYAAHGSGGKIVSQYLASGGIVQPLYLAGGSDMVPFAPKGTDTVPAMLTPGEKVIPVGGDAPDQPSNAEVVAALEALRSDITGGKLSRTLARSLSTALVGLRTAS